MELPHPWKKFRANPWSIRWATSASVSVSVVLVAVGALAIRIFDPEEYPTFGEALWFTLQTITTVGYGDSTPETTTGRVVSAIVMLVSIALIAVVTAVITSIFIDSARTRRRPHGDDSTSESLARIESALAATHQRLERIERATAAPGPDSDGAR